MKAEILLVTYAPDYDFTSYTLRSIAKFGSGFSGITIVVPYRDMERFAPLAKQHGCTLRGFYEAAGKGFLHHQVCKCEADLWCPRGTDLVVHIDADCVFKEPFTLETFLKDGKPILLRERYEDFAHYPARASWQNCVEHALGVKMPWETMVRHPGVFWTGMYREMRDRIETVHVIPFTQYVLLQKNDFPQTFAEFPTIGGFALAMEKWRDKYAVVTRVLTPSEYWREKGITPGTQVDYNLFGDDVSTNGPLVSPVRYFWSREGVTPLIRGQLETLLA